MIGVYSYSRSGTFYLTALLNRNFTRKHPVARFAGHEQWTSTIGPDRAIYIVRNPVDCLHSCWRCWYQNETLDAYAVRAVRRWKQHVEPWCDAVYWVRYEDLLADLPGTLAPLADRFGLQAVAEWQDFEDPIGFRPGEAAQRTPAPRDGGRYLRHFAAETLEAFRDTLGDRFVGYDLSEMVMERRRLCESCV